MELTVQELYERVCLPRRNNTTRTIVFIQFYWKGVYRITNTDHTFTLAVDGTKKEILYQFTFIVFSNRRVVRRKKKLSVALRFKGGRYQRLAYVAASGDEQNNKARRRMFPKRLTRIYCHVSSSGYVKLLVYPSLTSAERRHVTYDTARCPP